MAEVKTGSGGPTYPLLRETTMREEEVQDAIEVCTSLMEKYGDDMERCTHKMRDGLAKRLGAGDWQVVVGASYAYSIEHEGQNMLFFYPNEKTGILAWKA